MLARLMILTLAAFASLGGGRAHAVEPELETVTVFAAASTKPALDTLAAELKTHGIVLRLVFAGSSTLARQIEAGAPADVYVSANAAWMDYLNDRGRLVPDTRVTVATNALVLIAGAPIPAPMMVFGPGYPLGGVLQGDRLAIADPDHVPAGQYAHQALTALGLWDQVKDQLALTPDVTGALLLVARGEARLGIVYASDVARAPGVHVFAPFPADSHAPIVYPAAIVEGRGGSAARRVLAALKGPQGRAAFEASGFGAKP